MYRQILLAILVTLPFANSMAQQSLVANTNTISSSNTDAGKFYYANRNEPPRAIEFKERTVVASSFLSSINKYFNIPTEFTFIEAESNTDNLGMHHRLLQQYYKGVPVEGMGYRVHERDGFVTSANGKAVRNINIEIQTVLDEESAFHLAVKHLQTKDTVFRPGKKLIVSKDFTFTPESFSVAFQFDIDVSLIERWRISIDARHGQVINKTSLVNTCFKEPEPPLPFGTGTGLTSYYGNQIIQVEKFESGSSRLKGQTENGGIIQTYDFQNVSILSLLLFFEWSKAYDFYSSDNTYNSSYLKPAVSAQWAAEQTFEYYFKKHNRNSFDNSGSAITSYVHVDRNMDNAFWTGKLLAFGDGSNNNPLVELDVVAHEFTHGVTQYEAHLQYYNESGALNESFSDIFGKAVEFDTFGDTATWQLAKYFRAGGLRDMSNPNLKNQPDTYQGDMWFTGYEDSGGVHYNSGVQNFWFYLLCEGGSGVNDHQMNYAVKSIGRDTAVNITYRNLTEYLSYNSDYLDSRIGSLLATADLYGKNSFAYQEVDKAWDAVGVIDEPIITSLELYDITATTVKFKGSLLPRGDAVNYHLEYGTTPALGTSSSIYNYTNVVAGIVTGLQSQTKYYIRLVATNENGTTFFNSEPFTTISLTPLVKIKQTVDVTETTATLYGQINPNSLPTSFYFEYGLTTAFGLVTASYSIQDTTEFLNVSAPVTDLQPRKTYYYRLVATNGFAPAITESVSFFTAEKPAISSYTPVSGPIGTDVTIKGHNFNAALENNFVSFGATRATVLSSSSTEIKVKVPAGASFGPITVLDVESGLAVQSVQEFVPTFTSEFKRGDLQLAVGITDLYIWNTKVEDMDGDNKPDIVCIHYQGFSIFQNVNQGGDLTSESFVRNTYPVLDFRSSDLYVVDLDGNGLKDVIGRYQNGLRIYPNFSSPGYIFFGPPVDLNFGYLGNLIFNDFDLDGHIDIAGTRTLPGDNNMFTIFRNQNPKGSLSTKNFEQRYEKFLPYYIYFLTAGDINNDGTPDLVAGAFYQNFLSILKNGSSPGVFNFEEQIVQDPTRESFVRYISHDLNQDGWKDIISHSPYLIGNVAVMENNLTSPNITLAMPAVVLNESNASSVQPGDINGDGKVDLIVAFTNRKFTFLDNKVTAGAHFSNSSFEKYEEYGMPLVDVGSGTVDTQITINDLNGDGRPEVINAYAYNFGPHDGYQMEIWQNSPNNCLDPSNITLDVSNNKATIILPPNTTLDQFEIEYKYTNYPYWYQVESTTLDLWPGYAYQLRARAKCHLGFTGYYYIDFAIDCVDMESFAISSVGIDHASLNSSSSLSSFEVQYSLAGKEQWETLSQWFDQITNLLPGTTYDLRFRGRCQYVTEFKYTQFTTLCPKLSGLTITNLTYNKAVVTWESDYTGEAILEYSANNADWNLIDETQTMSPLIPGKQYFLRGKLTCTDINSDFIYTSFTTPCPKATNLNVDSITPSSANVTWFDESNTGSYSLRYSVNTHGKEITVETNSTSFNLKTLNPGTQYKVAVAPQCIIENDYTTTIFSTVCYAPFNLSVNAITHTTVELSWDDNISGSAYSVDYSIVGSNNWLTTETTLTDVSLSDLRPGTKYEARVHINCLSVKAPYVSLVFNTSLYDQTVFFPNPTDDNITIHPSKTLIGNHFSICDEMGRQITNGYLASYTIDLSAFSPGVYILKIEGEKNMKIVKR
jgi:Zn-dependent metalloprotease